MQSGSGKLHNISGVTEFFTSLGLLASHFTAIEISNLELFGGALLALGLGSRIIGLVSAQREDDIGLHHCRSRRIDVRVLGSRQIL